jgi:protease I
VHKLDYYRMPHLAARVLKEKKVLLILPSVNFSEQEFDYIYDYLKRAQLSVKIASVSGTARGDAGMEVKATIRLSDVEPDDFDAILLLGDVSGSQIHELSENPTILQIVKRADAKKKILAATGRAPQAIAQACLLKGRMMTAWRDPGIASLIKQKGGSYVWEPVILDGNLITADGPSSVAVFTDMLIDALTR